MNSRTSLIIAALVALLACAGRPAHAFELFPTLPKYFWLGLTGGAAEHTNSVSGSVAWNFNAATETRILTFRNLYSLAAEVEGADGETLDAHGISEAGLLYGLRFRQAMISGSASAGLAYVTGAAVDGLQVENFSTIGIPASLQLSLQPLPVLGFTAELYGDLNMKESFGGYLLGLQLGWLWKKL